MPLLEKLLPVEAGIEEDVPAVAANQPHEHGDVQLAAVLGAGHQLLHGEVGNGGIADRVNLVLRSGLAQRGRGESRKQQGDTAHGSSVPPMCYNMERHAQACEFPLALSALLPVRLSRAALPD